MQLHKQISTRLSSVLFLAMYVSFLCFQVTYNLAIARSAHPLSATGCLSRPSGDGAELSAVKKHGGIVAKIKQGPSKRFYQKVMPFVPTAVIGFAQVYFVPEVFFQYTTVFDPSSPISCERQRGPPSLS